MTQAAVKSTIKVSKEEEDTSWAFILLDGQTDIKHLISSLMQGAPATNIQ